MALSDGGVRRRRSRRSSGRRQTTKPLTCLHPACVGLLPDTPTAFSGVLPTPLRVHTYACVCIRMHACAYVCMRVHTYACDACAYLCMRVLTGGSVRAASAQRQHEAVAADSRGGARGGGAGGGGAGGGEAAAGAATAAAAAADAAGGARHPALAVVSSGARREARLRCRLASRFRGGEAWLAKQQVPAHGLT